MKEQKKILFLAQEIYPFLPEETPIRLLNRDLVTAFLQNGYEPRTFMPKLGEINERRNQLHEVIRLSGQNLIIDEHDHPILIKVAGIPGVRTQVYFIDNDDYFRKRRGFGDENGEYKDNDERCIFFTRSVLETVKKQCWTPDVVYCSGWMTALVAIYVKKAYADTPFFRNAKVVLALDDMEYSKGFGTKFARKLLINDMTSADVRTIEGFEVGYEELMRLAVDNCDAVVYTSKHINTRLSNYINTKNKPVLEYIEDDENKISLYIDFVNRLICPPDSVQE